MKIVSKPNENWSKHCTCNRCETVAEVEVGDFKRTVFDQRDGSAATYQCPGCGAEQWVDLNLIPRHLHHRLPR